ncbi:purine-nucleoside phosphorylase [Thermoflexus sp.]|uniref:purine-nucleoside phosphorylase n=1 Tax=Thermoflexus sp. TaxID=1969742 RepID=UPI0025DC145B|nr:purine-nucleoside phosphorylase [Thermoflexus sp.]MDW8180017.1 purine-nucleoside phosphorylase [Anaerolineae bacterium]MCS6962878.1 purine-nucleoside phosphorylase [Thermoflexus sp.]MCS7350566.1 purine-nucleoside phosphorylase [Thermoflexus sp.]MCX7690717.1 purine-nucleoside phosphorylase [Thermoflexus sp.]MDW8185120.1 purine-nucleoside phosphorylase [Anaerolineae bacterium]
MHVHEMIPRAEYEAAAAWIRERISFPPRIGLVLGSGLAPLADVVEASITLAFTEIPGFPAATVEGHPGRVIIGRLEGHPVMVLQGRAHFYEGYSVQRTTFPIRVMQLLGVRILILTNAAGGLNPGFRPGDVMILRDHIGLFGMAGANPLRGPNEADWGPRFPDLSRAYDPELRALAREVAEAEGIPTHEGVYVMLGGPSFETPAEVRFLRLIGADAVGMSTVPEVIVACHGGMRVLALSGISNVLNPDAFEPPTHEEVLQAGRVLVPRLTTIIRGVLQRI